MPTPEHRPVTNSTGPDPRWRDLYRVGAVACILFPASIVFAIIAYLIWPYTPGASSVADIFVALQSNRLAGLMSLDLAMVPIMPMAILHLLALYVALKPVNESYALIALVLGLVGTILILTARPMVEMVYLSNQYATATSEAAKAQYLAAGEAFHALFGGTAWLWWNILIGIGNAINSALMLRSPVFSKVTAYLGIGISLVTLVFWIPGIGALLSLLATAGSVAWYLLQIRTFFRLGWGQSNAPQAA
jgi:hypothetical protein